MEGVDFSQIWEQYRFGEVQGKLEEMFPEFSFSLEDMLSRIMTGDVIGALADGLKNLLQGMSAEVESIRNVFVLLLVLGIISALLAHFTGVFENHQVADISFYFVYLLLIAVLFKCFRESAQTTGEALGNIVDFIKIFIPAYFVAVGFAGGTLSAMAGYQMVFILIFFVEQVLLAIVVPLIYSYVMLTVINGVWMEERLGILLDFLKKIIAGGLKTAVGIVTGISVVQSMITPVIDSVKTGGVQKAVSMIPGIGNVADGMVEIMMSSAVLIKNSIGVVFVIFLLVVCMVPLLKLFVIAGCLKVSAAMMGIVSDKRITNCTNKVGEGTFMLFRTTGTAMLLFIILIAIAAYSTNRGI